MKAEGTADLERLTMELTTMVPGGHGYSWIIG